MLSPLIVGSAVAFIGIAIVVLIKILGKPKDTRMQPQSPSSPATSSQAGQLTAGSYGLFLVDENGKSVEIQELPVTLGRTEDNQVILKESTISAHHARIDYHRQLEAVYIEDLDSLNGLYIDGRATQKNILQDGVKVRLGSVTLIFRDTGYIHPLT